MKITVIIPTYRRPVDLRRAIAALKLQTRPAEEIIIGTRDSDSETSNFLAEQRDPAISSSTVSEPGVIASMQAAVTRSTGDVVCLLDDDAEPAPDWLARIDERFTSNASLGALGGRDLLLDHPDMRATEPLTTRVGIITWYGRILGNHHRGDGTFRTVDCFKGCNAAIRGDLIREIGFEPRLRGHGAQVHWELALALDVARSGFDVGYDPAITVRHHIAERHDSDLTHRGVFSEVGLYDMVYNEHLVIRTRRSCIPSTAHLLWSFAVGWLEAPGLIQYLRLIRRRDPHRNHRLATTVRAIRNARFGDHHPTPCT